MQQKDGDLLNFVSYVIGTVFMGVPDRLSIASGGLT